GAQSSMWVPIIEKAFAEYMATKGYTHGYADVAATEAGDGMNALGVFGGRSRGFREYGSATALAAFISDRWQNHKAVTVSWGLGGTVTNLTKYLPGDLINNQSYTVAGLTDNGVVASITLRNPWGIDTDSPSGAYDGHNDGYVTVTPDQLYAL